MNVKTFNYYIESMRRIEAQEVLMQMKIADFPNMKSDARGRLHRRLHMKAYPPTENSNKPLSTEQVFALLKGV